MTETTQTQETESTQQTAKPKGKKSKKADARKMAREAGRVPARKDRAPRPELVVFAFRLTKDQRDTIHAAAGPAKASQFVLNAALAAAAKK